MIKKLSTLILLTFPVISNALVTFDDWSTNEGISGNYIVTVEETGTDGIVDFSLTVDPWNAEALGVFFDFGDYDVPAVPGATVTFTDPAGQIALFATDTSSNSCGAGCNINGLNPTLLVPDDQWELVFRLGDQGYEGFQTFNWRVEGLTDFDESMAGLVAVRAQVLCSGTDLLPDDNGSCEGSDKSFGSSSSSSSSSSGTGPAVPEPNALALLGFGLLASVIAKRRTRT